MKKILSLLVMFLALQVGARPTVKSRIEKVKVFMRNAQITRKAQTTVNPGKQEIVLTGISTTINPSSLQIQFENSRVELLSAKYEPNYLIEKVNNPKIDALKVKSEELSDELAWLSDQKKALVGMEEILKKNQNLGSGQAGFTPAQVIELSNNYKKKYLEIRKELKGLSKQEKALNLKLTKTNRQLQEMNALFNKPSGTIVLQVSSNSSSSLKIKCSYTVKNAGWTPLYDLRSKGITEKMKLNYRANVYQNTGIDWNNVDLIVSTGNPAQNNERPILHPLYAKITVPYKAKVVKREGYVGNLGYSGNMANSYNMALDDNMGLSKGKFKDGYIAQAQIGEHQMNVEFKVSNSQSVLSDGKQNLMALNTYELPTNYVYHAVPKLCNGAFLIAKISDWSQYNLLPGKANIFYEGAFVGTSTINPEITVDTMLISMGRDNGIVVERNPVKGFSKKSTLGSNKKQTIGYELVVKNKKAVPITIEILDQIPVSKTNQIDVNLSEKGNAVYSKSIGKLLWTTDIGARNSWKDQFVYSVKYPKSNIVAGIK